MGGGNGLIGPDKCYMQKAAGFKNAALTGLQVDTTIVQVHFSARKLRNDHLVSKFEVAQVENSALPIYTL